MVGDSTPAPRVPLERLLRRREVAALFGLNIRTLERLDAEGNGPPHVRIGRSVRYHPSAVEQWLGERSGGSTRPRPAA